jgi:hypothetical protein
MPDRYWVGGTASWDATAGTKWSATSGGAGGASVPTTADAVFFTNLSTGTCTIATGNTGAASINCTGFAGTITGSAAITVAGSVTLVAAMTYTHTGTMTFTGTGTLTTAGKSFGTLIVNGAGITLTLGDPLGTAGRSITITQGTFTTANHNISCGNFSSSSSNAKTINFGTSAINIASTLDFSSNVNLTFNAGTSTVSFGPVLLGTLSGGNQTFYNVSFTTISSGTRVILGANTFNNLTINTGSTGLSQLSIAANQVVNGTFTCAGSSAIARGFVRSDTSGTVRAITAAAVSATDCDFRDIAIAGAAAPISPTRAGNCGGNSGITFPAAKTVYRVGTNTTWAGSSSWAPSSGGTGNNNNFPLPQDTAVIDNSTTLTGTLNISDYNISGIDASTRTTGITLAFSPTTLYGSVALGLGITVSGGSIVIFAGRGTMVFTSAGKILTFPILIDAPGGTFRLFDALTTTGISVGIGFEVDRGTLDLNGNTLTTVSFDASFSATRTLAFGTGNITVTGTGTVWNTGTITNLTVTGTPVVNVTNATATAATVSPGLLTEANSISFNFTAGTYSLTVGNNVRSLNFTGFAGSLNNVARTIFGDVTFSTGMTVTAGASTQTFASTSGTPRTIRTNGKTLDFPLTFDGGGGTFRLLDAFTMGSTRTLTHTNGTLDLNGFNLTVGTSYTTASGTKNITFNGGTLTCPNSGTSAFNNAAAGGFTTTAGTGIGTINMTSASAKTFIGGGATYNCTLNNGGAGALTITGSNTFTTLQNTVQPTSFLFTTGTTTTLTNWAINGTAGNLVTIGSSTAAPHILSKASGTVSADYLSISRSTATGGAVWYAGANSTNGGNNTGWIFSAAPGIIAAMAASEIGLDIFAALVTIGSSPQPVPGDIYRIELRSFTERRRF